MNIRVLRLMCMLVISSGAHGVIYAAQEEDALSNRFMLRCSIADIRVGESSTLGHIVGTLLSERNQLKEHNQQLMQRNNLLEQSLQPLRDELLVQQQLVAQGEQELSRLKAIVAGMKQLIKGLDDPETPVQEQSSTTSSSSLSNVAASSSSALTLNDTPAPFSPSMFFRSIDEGAPGDSGSASSSSDDPRKLYAGKCPRKEWLEIKDIASDTSCSDEEQEDVRQSKRGEKRSRQVAFAASSAISSLQRSSSDDGLSGESSDVQEAVAFSNRHRNRYETVRKALKRGDYGKAFAVVEDDIEDAKQQADLKARCKAHFLLGKALRGSKQYEDAIKAFQFVVDNMPNEKGRTKSQAKKHLEELASKRRRR